jgi:hypothetical protein
MALAGDHVIVRIDGTAFQTGDITSVDLGQTFTQHDVTGFGDAAQHFINGQLQSPVTIKGFVTTGATGTHTVLNTKFSTGDDFPLVVEVGQNAAPTTGDPKFSGTYIVESYKPTLDKGSAVTFEATLKPFSGTPAWGTI